MSKRQIRFFLLTCLLALALAVSALAVDVTAQYTTWEKATVAEPGQPVTFTMDTYNADITASQIWIAVNVEQDNQAIQMALSGISTNSRAYLFRESDLSDGSYSTNEALCSWSFSSGATYQWKADTAGIYYLMLRPYNANSVATKAATLTCTLVNGDLNESNDTWQTATELTENVNTYYNLAGQNDVDWFKITTAVPARPSSCSSATLTTPWRISGPTCTPRGI